MVSVSDSSVGLSSRPPEGKLVSSWVPSSPQTLVDDALRGADRRRESLDTPDWRSFFRRSSDLSVGRAALEIKSISPRFARPVPQSYESDSWHEISHRQMDESGSHILVFSTVHIRRSGESSWLARRESLRTHAGVVVDIRGREIGSQQANVFPVRQALLSTAARREDRSLAEALEELGEVQDEAREEGTTAPTDALISRAEQALRDIHQMARRTYGIYAMPYGDVVIDIEVPPRCKLVVICREDGSFRALMATDDGKEHERYWHISELVAQPFLRNALEKLAL